MPSGDLQNHFNPSHQEPITYHLSYRWSVKQSLNGPCSICSFESFGDSSWALISSRYGKKKAAPVVVGEAG